jgi:hypothetical protein
MQHAQRKHRPNSLRQLLQAIPPDIQALKSRHRTERLGEEEQVVVTHAHIRYVQVFCEIHRHAAGVPGLR